MEHERTGGDASRARSAQPSGLFGRLLFRLAAQLFGGQASTPADALPDDAGEPQASPPPAPTPATEAARILEHALERVETVLGELEEAGATTVEPERPEPPPHDLPELRGALRDLVRRLEGALDRIGLEVQRVAHEASRLSQVADRLEERVELLAQALRRGGPPPAAPVPEPERGGAPPEPQFSPGEQPLDVVIAAVPGFQGLMDVQRGLSGLPAIAGASVHSYRNGEAALELALRTPLTARQIIDALREATGHQFLIEEARPEASHLRLRCTNGEPLA